MKDKQDEAVLKKGRLTLTGNKMPDEVYKKLEEKGSDRKLTPYIVSLVEKEETMDKLIESLSIIIHKIDRLDEKVSGFETILEGANVSIVNETVSNEEDIKQGDLKIGENIIGGIEEEIEEMDF
ncbi:hypothetical protein [Cytobacillus horneckiae]|uniref:hypothetical protein n=1 Tax=Cytobacillus horneckiae TaxID=549687 RepID=UPI003D1AD9F3